MAGLGRYKWIAFGDSLTDNTIPSPLSAGNPKYHTVISDAESMPVKVRGYGGRGYWKTRPFYQFMQDYAYDEDVDVVTIFGSVNDWTYQAGSPIVVEGDNVPNLGRCHDGGIITMADYCKNVNMYHMVAEELISTDYMGGLTFDDTVANTQSSEYGISFIGYVNDCINEAHNKFPRAVIVLVSPLYFGNANKLKTENVGEMAHAVVLARRARGDTWLSYAKIITSVYSGNDPNAGGIDARPGYGLSFFQTISETGYDPTVFRNLYCYDAGATNGHPNTLYNRIWLAPIFANILCYMLGVPVETISDSLRLSSDSAEDAAQRQILYRSFEPVPTPPVPRTTYTAKFTADGAIVDTVEFNAGATVLPRVPAVPAKEGYTGAWEPYTLADADITINAIYTANTYRVTFVADGVTVAVVPYRYGTQSITEPSVPPKDGYTGAWSAYTLGAHDSVSMAVYTPIEWEPTGYALSPTGPVMAGLRPDGTEAHEGLTPAGAVAFRRYAD